MRTHRAYSVRQISPGDRRLLAEFVATLTSAVKQSEAGDLHGLASVLFDRVISAGDASLGFAALENTAGGDRVIGVAAYVSEGGGTATFKVAVANSFRDEQVGRTLLSTLVRHAKRVGVTRLEGEMTWSNRAMQMLAMSLGFGVEHVADDRHRRRLVLRLK